MNRSMLGAAALALMAGNAVVAVAQTRESLPDRVSGDPKSPHYRPDVTRIGIIFKGVERFNVFEYCISEGWVRVIPRTGAVGRDGTPITLKMQGRVEPFWR